MPRVLLHKVQPNCYFNQLGVPLSFLKELDGAVAKKRLKNTASTSSEGNVPCNEDENEDEEANDEADDDDGHDVAVDQRLQDVVQRLNLGVVIVI